MHERGEKYIVNFGWNAKGKKPLGRPRHRWKDNIRTDLNGNRGSHNSSVSIETRLWVG